MCSLRVWAVMPTIAARASGFQYGALKPANAGTRYTPPLSSTARASASVSAASRISPS